MSVKLKLIAAASENMGIGKNNDLPWRLKTEMAYFTKMTSQTADSNKKNVVILGRRTWDSIPPKFKPLVGRFNFILSRGDLDVSDYKNCYSFKSLENAIKKLQEDEFKELYENVWVIGGSHIYAESMNSAHFYQLYMTEIKKNFDCDTFFPKITRKLKDVTSDCDVPQETQEEKGIRFQYKVYEVEENAV